mgnify:CR=1 FL=1
MEIQTLLVILVLVINLALFAFVLNNKQIQPDFLSFSDRISENNRNNVKEIRSEIELKLNETNTVLNQRLAQLQADNNALNEKLLKRSQKEEVAIANYFLKNQENSAIQAAENRAELRKGLNDFKNSFEKNVNDFNSLQKQKFAEMELKQKELIVATELKLEKMRETVDEKLHKTLEDRLGQSFKLVSDKLEAVQKGLGEMQTLATGVGDLKKVLSNVKTRGVLGEIQLGNILEQILSPEQYEANVATKKATNDRVEFAVKLPGKSTNKTVFLPIDAKFPQEDFIRLQDAYELGDALGVQEQTKNLLNSVKRSAKEIHEKYVDPPNTTDFAILFLPIEGLFAEITRHPGLLEEIQRKFKVILTGPTTLSAILNSLQLGFKTLAIQKRSSEVWGVLNTVKKEFKTFGDVLEKTQNKLNAASTDLEKLVGTRTRMMLSKLNKVEEIEPEDTNAIGE